MKITKKRLKRIIKEEIERFKEDIMPGKIKPGWLDALSDQAQKEWFNSPSIQSDIAVRRDDCGKRNMCLDPETFECIKCVPGHELEEKKKDDNWIQGAEEDIEKRGTEGVCTGDKFGSESCPPGSKRYNLAKTFRKMAKKRKRKSK
tara:strand:- start:485 stop:922 length:438 start_codon:yes stop_codon:yes gene_type:complete